MADDETEKVDGTMLLVGTSGSLKIKSGTYTGEIRNKGTLKISGGTLNPVATYLVAANMDVHCILIDNRGTATISGGTFSGSEYDWWSEPTPLISNQGTMTISGGKFTCTCGWLLMNEGTLTISDGTYTSKGSASFDDGAIVNWGKATIRGGTFNTKYEEYTE